MKSIANTWAISLLIFPLTAFTGPGSQVAKVPANEDLLKRSIGEIHLVNTTATDALTVALNRAQVPGGVVSVHACSEEPKRDFVLSGSTLRDVLDAVVQANPNSRWYIDQGVVNLVPKAGLPPFVNTTIQEFNSQKATNPTFAYALLVQDRAIETSRREAQTT